MPGDIGRQHFTELVQTFDPDMRRLAWRLLGSQSAMDDALQDAYLKAFRKLSTFQGDDSAFRGWLYRIVYNTCLDHLRKAKRHRDDVDIDAHRGIADQGIAIGDRVVRRSQLIRALQALPADQAAALTLVDGEGYSYDEVAVMLDAPRGTIASRVNRARASIRRLFEIDSEEVTS